MPTVEEAIELWRERRCTPYLLPSRCAGRLYMREGSRHHHGIIAGAMSAFFVMEQNGGATTMAGAVLAYAFYFCNTGLVIALVDALLKSLEREQGALSRLGETD
jgi:hypothetical protein